MPYEGEKLSMLILLPKGTADLSLLENSLSLDKINDWKSKLKEQRIDVFMPKFTFDTKYFMNETLAKMGMPTAFTDRADLSRMDGTKNLFI
jgi:serpin B